jgi:hypothetical protein
MVQGIPTVDHGASCIASAAGLFPRDPRHPVTWQARRARKAGVGGGALAEGLGIRAVARVFEVGSHYRPGVVGRGSGACGSLRAVFLHDVHVTQVQLDELFALLSAVKTGEVSEAEAITRLSRSRTGCGRRSIRSRSCC